MKKCKNKWSPQKDDKVFKKLHMFDSDYEYNELKSFGINIICYVSKLINIVHYIM